MFQVTHMLDASVFQYLFSFLGQTIPVISQGQQSVWKKTNTILYHSFKPSGQGASFLKVFRWLKLHNGAYWVCFMKSRASWVESCVGLLEINRIKSVPSNPCLQLPSIFLPACSPSSSTSCSPACLQILLPKLMISFHLPVFSHCNPQAEFWFGIILRSNLCQNAKYLTTLNKEFIFQHSPSCLCWISLVFSLVWVYPVQTDSQHPTAAILCSMEPHRNASLWAPKGTVYSTLPVLP